MEDGYNFLNALYVNYLNHGNHKFFNVNDIAEECDISDINIINKTLLDLEASDFLQIIRTPIQIVRITNIGIDYIKEKTLRSHKDNVANNKSTTNVKILFFASNPENNNNHLELDREARDLLQKINEENPDVIHFSGHGSDGSIYLQDDNGSFKKVSCEALTAMFKSLNSPVRLIVFNNCHSNTCATEVISVVDAAIGMSDAIGDEAAIHFAAQLYSSIGFGLSIEKSYEQAKARILLEDIDEGDTPQLHGKSGINLSKMKLININ